MSQPRVVFAGNTGITITDTLVLNNAPYDLTSLQAGGGNVKLWVRGIDPPTLLPNFTNGQTATMVQPYTQGQVSYTPSSSDFVTPGPYKAWWQLNFGGNQPADLPEWDLIVAAHVEGVGTQQGLIARRAASMMPTSWAKLQQLPQVGDWELQNKVEVNKRRWLGPSVYVGAAAEYTLDPVAADWLAKRTVLDVVPTAVDYWLDKRISANTPQEHATYGNRVEALKQLGKQLENELDENFQEFQSIVGPYTRKKAYSPASDSEMIPLITPDPTGMASAYGLYLPRVLTPDYYIYPYTYPFPTFKYPTVGGVGP